MESNEKMDQKSSSILSSRNEEWKVDLYSSKTSSKDDLSTYLDYSKGYEGNEENKSYNYEKRTTWGYGDDNDVENVNYQRQSQGQDQNNNENDEDEDENENNLMPGVDDLPLFSNQISKQLNNQIHEKESKIIELERKILDMRERVKIIKEHSKNVQTELNLTNDLHSSKRLEIQTENHLRMLTTRSLEKEKLYTKQVKNDLEQVQENLSNIQNNIYQTNQKLDEFKLQMNWNQTELEQWILASKQKEEDNNMIAKYSKIDEQKIKDLTFELEKLTKELLLHKENLDNELIETQAKQMELDRIAIDFKNSHNERKDLIARWQDIINEMKKRDIEINDIGERFAKAKSERMHREQLINIQRGRLTSQQNENKEVESKFELLSRVVVKKREELIAGSLKLQEFRDELESLKNVLTNSAEALVIKRKLNMNKSQLVEDRKANLEKERNKYHLTKERLELTKMATTEVEGSARNAEDVLNQKEKELQQKMASMKDAKERLFKESQTVYDLKREETRLKNEVSGTKLIIRNLDGSLVQLDREASRQQELLYNAEFQIQQIERKVSRGMGERSDDEKKELRVQIDENDRILANIKEKKKILMSQSRKLGNELALMKIRKEELTEKMTKLSEKLSEKEIENKMINEEIKRDIKEKEDMTVQNDLHRLDVKRLKDLLSAKADAVFSLENRRQQLVLSMEERKTEIAVHRDVLKAELKTIQEEKHNLVMDLRSREAQIEKLKARYESIAAKSSDPNEINKDDSVQFQSHYIIQAAQRREELTRRGDELDFLIRQCERELRAQQLTLDHLNARNIAFRDSFKKVDNNSEDAEVLKQYEEQMKIVKDNLFRKKKELQRLLTDVEEDEHRLEQVKGQYSRVSRQKENYQSAKQQVEDEILTQQGQIEELNSKISTVISKHRNSSSTSSSSSTKRSIDIEVNVDTLESGTLEEKSALAEVMKDCVQNVLYTLGQLSSEFPELSDYMNQKLRDADLRIPARPPTRNKPLTALKNTTVESSSSSAVSSMKNSSVKPITRTVNPSATTATTNRTNPHRTSSSIVIAPTNFQLEV